QYGVVILLGYLLGSIPFGYLVCRARGVDVTQYGSGRIGGTNVLRTAGKKAAAVSIGCDVLKGALAVLLARCLAGTELAVALAGFAAVVGHNYSLYIGFRGGAGTGTSMGAYFFMAPWPTLIVGLSSAFIGFVVLRYASVTSLLIVFIMSPALLIGVLFFQQPMEHLAFALAVGALVLWSHRPNIKRLLQGTERRIGEPAQKIGEEKAR
ncbi:MAG: glycerol-3-phosphate 1-O-acyltransferase PlsY, partial [Anaerolineae bacterium]|nr:glycerol-3-phosphate 1-O-acyltransferase PlsY [Anaerolineae bacterium]